MDFSTRIKILNLNEVQELYSLPKLDHQEQEFYFSMDSVELSIAYSYRTLATQVFFILQLGYFKAKKMFFLPTYEEVKEDITFITNKYFSQQPLINTTDISKTTTWEQQQKILHLVKYQYFDDYWKTKLQEKAKQNVKISSKPEFIFKVLFHYLEKSQVVIPSYSTMQKIISKILVEEKQRLSEIADKLITNDVDTMLQELLAKEDKSYLLTLMKKEPKSFQYKQILQELDRQKILKPLYIFAKDFLPSLGISNDNIKYYASLVDYYSIFRLRRLSVGIFRIYLLCFIYKRYHRINDNLATTLVYLARKYAATAKLAAKETIYALKLESNRQLKNVSKVLGLFLDDSIAGETSFSEIRKIAFSIVNKEKFPILVQYISKVEFDQTEFEWKAIESLSKTFKKNLRPIFSSLDIGSTNKNDHFIDAVNFLKAKILKKRSLTLTKPHFFPQSFISRKHKHYIFKKKKVKIQGSSRKTLEVCSDRYEFLIYSFLEHYLTSGDIYVSDSNGFRSFEDDLVDEETLKNKELIIQQLDLSFLSKPIEETLNELNIQLETLLLRVNTRIKDGSNQAVKITTSGEDIKWSLPYNKLEDITNHTLFEQIPQIEICDLLALVDSKTGFMTAFTHILSHYVKGESSNEAISGSLVALATNKGLPKMAESSDLTYQALFSAMKNHLRPETLKNANDKISNSTFLLPIFQYFNVQSDVIHSSSDGQKFETQINTINSRYSPKYFGLKKGIVSYTMIANNVPVNAKIIGAHEHESHHVFDVVHSNTSDIDPDRHSVDSHGTNNINFLILHAFGYEFAPRYKDINSKTDTICSFNNPKEYSSFILKPSHKIKPSSIIKEWPNMQRIFISLALKTTTQSVIVSKLSSYARKNRTRKAMWEFDSIFRSIYLLNYIDDILLRQNVQKALNRGEAYHQLRRAISHENAGKFRVDSQEEQLLWSECSRLVANAIIFYNSYLLSKLLVHLEENKEFEALERVKKVSPIAWTHINLAGRFEFTNKKNPPDIDSLLTTLTSFFTKSQN